MSFIPKTDSRPTAQAVHSGAPGPHAAHREAGSGSGIVATSISGIALLFSGFSYYESSLKTAEMQVFVPPMIHYARDGADVFNVPVTIANDGAKSGTVLGLTLDAENLDPKAERKKITFHGIFLGDYPRDEKAPLRSFAPLSIPGHGVFTETVRFYNMGEALPLLVTDKGDFRFTLTVQVARNQRSWFDNLFYSEPKPLTFDLNLPYLSVQALNFRNSTIAMYSKDWQTAVSETQSRRLTPGSEPSADDSQTQDRR